MTVLRLEVVMERGLFCDVEHPVSFTMPARMIARTVVSNDICRGYMVIVSKTKGQLFDVAEKAKNLMSYPIANGTTSIKTMKTLSGRGFDVRAITSGFGVVEYLTLSEMEAAVLPGY